MPASRRHRRLAKLGNLSRESADQVDREFADGSRRLTPKRKKKPNSSFPPEVNRRAESLIERLDENPDLTVIPFIGGDTRSLSKVKGDAIALLIRRINQTLEKRIPREKIAAHNAGKETIESMGKKRFMFRLRKRVSLGVYEHVEFDSIRRVKVKRVTPRR